MINILIKHIQLILKHPQVKFRWVGLEEELKLYFMLCFALS